MGLQSMGVAKVLSIIRGMPCFLATLENFSKSKTVRAGFAIVSPKISFVLSLIAASISASSASQSTKTQSMPYFFKVTAKRLNVPP